MLNTKLNTVTAKRRFIGVPFELVIRFCFPVRYLRKLRSDGSTHRPPLSVRIPHGIMDGGIAYKDSRHAERAVAAICDLQRGSVVAKLFSRSFCWGQDRTL